MNYYTLSREGYRLLHGPDAPLPGHRAFEPLSPSRLPHSLALADFLVHTIIGVHRQAGYVLTDFHRENSLRLEVGATFLYPDCTFRIHAPDGRTFEFFTEIDNGTETIATADGNGTFERKIRFYENFRNLCVAEGRDHRFRVLLVTTGSGQRLHHMLARTLQLVQSKNLPLVYGITLNDYLACTNPIGTLHFCDHRRQWRALIPPPRMPLSPTAQAAAEALAHVGAV